MTAKIIPLGCVTRLDLDADMVLENLKGKLEGFVYAGWDKEGLFYAGSTYADGGDTLWLLEQCKRQLLKSRDG